MSFTQVIDNIHLHMSNIQDFVESLLLAGLGARISKKDLCEAFNILTVHRSQWSKQAIKVFNCIIVALKQTYGDKQAKFYPKL